MSRQVFAVGRISPQEPRKLARVCAWCNRFFTFRDMDLAARGAEISHGLCRECARDHTPPEAA